MKQDLTHWRSKSTTYRSSISGLCRQSSVFTLSAVLKHRKPVQNNFVIEAPKKICSHLLGPLSVNTSMNTLWRVLVLANEQIPPCISLSTDTKLWFSEFKRVSWTGNNGNPSYVSSRKAAVWAVSFWFHEWPNRAHRSPGVGSSQVFEVFIVLRHCHYLGGRNASTIGLKPIPGSLWHVA